MKTKLHPIATIMSIAATLTAAIATFVIVPGMQQLSAYLLAIMFTLFAILVSIVEKK